MDGFLPLAGIEGMADGELRQSSVDGHELVVAKVNGTYLVADNRCPHLGGRLSKGELEGTVITCHLHHSKFDLATGEVLQWTNFAGPVRTIAELARHPRSLRVYEVRVEGEQVFVGEQKPPVG